MRFAQVLIAAALVLVSQRSDAQSLYAFDPTLTVSQFTGPAAGPCLYPIGPISAFPTPGVLCPGPAPFAAPFGDIAVDPTTDIIYVTDGAVISAYSTLGAHLGSAIPPLPGLTGMGVGVPGLLWITNGFIYGAVPLGLGCPVGPLAFAVGPFPVPIGPIFGGPIGDLDFEPFTGSLIACDATGLVGSFMPGPGPVLGPYGVFPVAPSPCLAGPGLVGIAFDKALPGTGTHYVTDGLTIARLLPGGGLAPPTFYSPFPCFPAPPVPAIAGLAYAGRQIPYGIGKDTIALPVPTIGSIGQSWIGNPAYTVTLAGSVPGGMAFLKYAFASACPPFFVLGLPLYNAPPRFTAIVVAVGAGGTASFTAPIPAVLPPGLSVYLQWAVLTGVSVQVTSGAELTTILP